MSDLPPDGSEPRNSKRPANVVRDSADRLDEAPPSKRSKAASTVPSDADARASSQPHVFHSRIFLSLIPEAFRAGRFTVLDKSALPALGAQNLICVSVDLSAQPSIVTIKKKVQHEHGYSIARQIIWTPDDGILSDPSICPDEFVKSGSVLYLTVTPPKA